MVTTKSMGTVSYSHSIVTMFLSSAISTPYTNDHNDTRVASNSRQQYFLACHVSKPTIPAVEHHDALLVKPGVGRSTPDGNIFVGINLSSSDVISLLYRSLSWLSRSSCPADTAVTPTEPLVALGHGHGRRTTHTTLWRVPLVYQVVGYDVIRHVTVDQHDDEQWRSRHDSRTQQLLRGRIDAESDCRQAYACRHGNDRRAAVIGSRLWPRTWMVNYLITIGAQATEAVRICVNKTQNWKESRSVFFWKKRLNCAICTC